MLIKEYRIPMPLSLEEYQKGLLYMIVKASEEESISGVPMKVLKNEEFDNHLGKGIYTHRQIFIVNRIPEWGRKILMGNADSLCIEERSWNAFPNIKTIYTCPLFSQQRFEIVVETRHVADSGSTNNAHNLPRNVLKNRIVDYIDIAFDAVDPRYYKLQEDPLYFHSKLTGRGPLKEKWEQVTQPIMCCYKLVSVNFSLWGLRTKMENLIHDVMRSIYLTTHRQCFCWIDEWFDLSIERIRLLEKDSNEKMDKDQQKLTATSLSSSFKNKSLKPKL
jgi:hypothetical protein